MIWKQLKHPVIEDNYLISPFGDIRQKGIDESLAYSPSYHSSNGYDYAQFVIKEEFRINRNPVRLFPIDEIVSMVYLPIPVELVDKQITVKHINGDTRDISLDNLEWIEDVEEWKTVTYPGIKEDVYEVSNQGRIRKKKDKTILNGGINHEGYFRIVINNKEYRIHRLVSWEFCKHGSEFMSKHVNHIDGVKINNNYKNLESISGVDNTLHAVMNGLILSCENCPNAKLTNETVELICKLIVSYKGNVSKIIQDPKLVNEEITSRDIHRIKDKDSWVHISDKYFKKDEYRSHPKCLQERDVIKICELNLKYPRRCKKIYQEARKQGINVSINAVKRIVYKITFRNISDKYF